MVVTGSRIRQTDVETAQPVQMIMREDIEKQGFQSVGDILQNVSAVGTPPISRASPLTAGQNAGGVYISLRNLGAERTLFVWEEHDDFNPIHDEPRSVWIERDDKEIGQLVALATRLIDELYRRTTGQAPPTRTPLAPSRRSALRERDMFRALALSE